jgi:dCMP deaminase
MECSKLIIQSGIIRVVYCNRYHNDDGLKLLDRAGIEVVYVEMLIEDLYGH